MSETEERRARARARRSRATIRKGPMRAMEEDLSPIRGAEALSLVHRLTEESWSLSGCAWPSYSRAEVPCRFVPGRHT